MEEAPYETLVSYSHNDYAVQVKLEYPWMRNLATSDYEGCPGLKTSSINWTTTTGFILGSVALVLAPIIWKKSPRRRDDRIMTCMFVVTSFAYGFTVNIARLLSESKAKPYTLRIAIGFMALHSMVLNYAGIRSTTGKLYARDLWAVLHFINIVLAFGLASALTVAINVPIVFYVTVIFLHQGIKKDKRVLLKFLGQSLIFSSMIFQISLNSKCGPDEESAIEKCFSECFLPQPLVFTYIAMQNILGTIGIFLTGIGEILVPASRFFVPMSSGNQASVGHRIAVPRTATSLRSIRDGTNETAGNGTVSNSVANENEQRPLSVVDEEVDGEESGV